MRRFDFVETPFFGRFVIIISMSDISDKLSHVIFLNAPKLSEHEVDKMHNDARLDLVPEVEAFISSHSRFQGEEVIISFFETGRSSLVCAVATSKEKLILKAPLGSLTGEAEFLEAWRHVGVKVPQIIEQGRLGSKPCMLMEFIGAKTLHDMYKKGEMVRREIYVQMGQILRTMHKAKASGFGRPVAEGRAEFLAFAQWFQYEIERKLSEVRKFGLLNDDEHGSFSLAAEVLSAFVEKNPQSVYCHNDFTYANIFATSPLTVFDPQPIFGHPYMDLGRAIVQAIGGTGRLEASYQFIEGYFGGGNYDQGALQAAVIAQSCFKFGYWYKTNRPEAVKDVQTYLSQTKYLLEK